VATYSFKGGDKFRAALAKLSKKVNSASLVDVGFFEGSTESKTGVSTPMVAATMEFGGTIPAREVSEHTTTIYRRVGKSGDFLNGAKFVKKGRSNFATEHVVPAHTIPAHKVPSRPYFRRMIKMGKTHWGDDLAIALKDNDYNSFTALALVGESMAGELVQSITDQVYEPLAKSTIQKKGFDTTLLDTGDMKRAVGFKVTE
jgi:hypothetical protein